MRRYSVNVLLLIIGIMSGCVEPYDPPVSVLANSILVVDGSINASANSARVKLTGAIALSASGQARPRSGANVRIEELEGSTFQLHEESDGIYTSTTLNTDFSKKYRLVIAMSGGTYQSEYVSIQQTPPIDSVTWEPDLEGITIKVNTHNAIDKSPFFLWTFTETWRYTAAFRSFYIRENGIISFRTPEQDIFTCFQSAESKTINVGSSSHLSSNIIRDFPIQHIAKGSEKTALTYSILVRQSSLSEEEYNYWQQLQRTTENLGGLFDPLPAQVAGNMTCVTDPSETVLGYFSGGAVAEKRVFIENRELPNDLRVGLQYPSCKLDSAFFVDLATMPDPVYLISTFGIPFPVGHTISTKECSDCREQGGTTTVPDFWQ